MPDEAGGEDRQWLLEPIAADEVRIHVDLGEGAELSEEIRAALDTLLEELHEDEVSGFVGMPSCPDLSSCTFYSCEPYGKCTLTRAPCLWDEKCKIASIR